MTTKTFEYTQFSISLRNEDIVACATYSYDEADKSVVEKEYVQDQLRNLPTAMLRGVLDEFGVDYDPNNRREIESLVVWDAACWLTDEEKASLHWR
jgi:hypothetical protein